MYKNMKEIKQANRVIGGHWFDKDTLEFFGSVVESHVFYGRFFITSERCRWDGDNGDRFYTVRECNQDGQIRTIGGFQAHKSLNEAIHFLETMGTN